MHTPRTTRQQVIRALQVLLLLLTIAAVGWALARNGEQAWADVKRADPLTMAIATAMSVLAPIFTMLGWRVLLADLGSKLRPSDAASVFFVGQLGKYLPGSVWSVVAQAEMAAALHVPRRRTAAVGIISLVMSVLTGVVVGLPALPLLLRRTEPAAIWVSLGLIVPIAVVLLYPPLLNWALATALRILRRDPMEHALSFTGIALTTMWFLLAWLAAGCQLLVLSEAVGGDSLEVRHLLLVGICGFALASAIGMFSFILPAGLGMREGMLLLLLAPAMGVTTATVIAVLSRFTSTIADIAVALGGWLWARSHHLLGRTS
ncbi:lysylphosphatidylglycerol synthase domain-containing protein [Actinomycetota bacterium]